MCPSAPRVRREPGGQKPVLSLSLDRIDRGEYIVCIGMDISKAFDCIPNYLKIICLWTFQERVNIYC